MHAVVITEPGGPDVLRWTEVPDPVPGPGEVLVDVAASAVNRADEAHRIMTASTHTGKLVLRTE